MTAQVIFFFALALFLILLVRRFRASSEIIDRVGGVAGNLGRSVGKIGSGLGSNIIERAKSVRDRIPLMSDRHDQVVSGSDSHAFWQEEARDEKAELAGFFDEGDELFKKGDYIAAEAFFLKAATRNPGDARVYARLGVIYLHQKNYNDAIESLKVAVKYDKHNPSRHYNLALAYLGNDDRQKAIACARESITLDPVTKKYRQLLDQLLERK